MLLSTDAAVKFDQVIRVAYATGIKNLIIETANNAPRIRGIDDAATVVILTEQGVPDLNGMQFATGSLDKLVQRLTMVRTQGDLSIEVTPAANAVDIVNIELRGGKSKIQFRAHSGDGMKIPKKLVDSGEWSVRLDPKVLVGLAQAVSFMKPTVITLASKDGKTVSFEVVDKSNDTFAVELEDPLAWIGSGSAKTSFCHSYSPNDLLTVLKEATKTSTAPIDITLGEGGSCSFKIGVHDFMLMAKI